MAGKDLETLTRTGRTIWNDALGKIQVKGNCEDSKTIFYTSLYRTYERMVCLSEDGQYYSAFDNQVHQDSGVPFILMMDLDTIELPIAIENITWNRNARNI